MDLFKTSAETSGLYIGPQLNRQRTHFLSLRNLTLLFVLAFSRETISFWSMVHIFSGKSDEYITSFSIDIADTEHDKLIGLSADAALLKNHGLLLVFDRNERVRIWTKTMSFAIDIIFINEKGKITEIFHSAGPGSNRIFESKSFTRFVLEVNSGEAKKFNLQKNDYIQLEYNHLDNDL